MEVVYIDFKSIPNLEKSVACIGFFDGMHRGHQALLDRTFTLAQERSLPSAVITFDPDPWRIFFPDRSVYHLFTLEDKMQYAKVAGIDYFYILQFTADFAANQVEPFHKILFQMQIHTLVCGFDFHYAYKNKGNIKSLREQTLFDVSVVQSINESSEKISSTRIESLVKLGDFTKANSLLGYVYSIQGIVEHGYQRGSKLLGYPTANLDVFAEYILPINGVYAGMVSVGNDMYGAMINVGDNPTFTEAKHSIEANIFNFDRDIYGQEVRFYFLSYLRKEIKFNSIQGLITQLEQDILNSKKELKSNRELVLNTAKIWEKKLFIEG